MDTIESVIHFLNERKLSVTTAESCTAGLAAALMADIPGCGTALQSGFVVYTEEAKHNLLDVSFKTMQAFGLTSEAVARELAMGALQKSSADIIVAITGTAESNDELNGVVCFAYAIRTTHGCHLVSETKSFDGERNQVRRAAATHAILSLPALYASSQDHPVAP